MSLSSTVCRTKFVGNNATSVFDYTFKIFQSSDLKVIVKSLATFPNQPTFYSLVLGTDYTVAGAGLLNGGSVSLISSGQAWLTSGKLTTGYSIYILRAGVLLEQNTDIKNQGPYYPELHEDEFDYLTMLIQWLSDRLDRSLHFGDSVTSDVFSTLLPYSFVGKIGAAPIVGPDGLSFVPSYPLGTIAPNAIYDAVVGAGAGCNYASLAAAFVDVQQNWRILVKDSKTFNTGDALVLSTSGVSIDFAPSVTYSKGTLSGPMLQVNNSGIRIRGGRFLGFDLAVQINSACQFNYVTECRFNACTVEVSELDSSPNNVLMMNISE